MPYSKINPSDMILRDHLAYDRTLLANERTLLAYMRTSIALLATGGTLVKIFPDEQPMVNLGIILLALGIIVLAAGLWRYIAISKKLALTYKILDE